MLAKTQSDIDKLRAGIERVGRLSDNIVKLGPFGVGVGGVLAWVPVLGPLYSFGAGLVLLGLGVRARAPLSALAPAFVILAARTLGESVVDVAGAIPFLSIPGDVAIDLFRAHKWSADMLIKAIDDTRYVEGRRHASNPAYAEARAAVRSRAERRRVVVLG
jgi:hypothetical protein